MPDLIAPSLGKLRRAARRLVERDRPVILMYHWVALLAHDPWHLAVSPDRFAEQIEELVQFRNLCRYIGSLLSWHRAACLETRRS